METTQRTNNTPAGGTVADVRRARRSGAGRFARIATAAAVAAGSLAAVASPASAGVDLGADSVTVTDMAMDCLAGQGLPCPSGAAVGSSNTIRVSQSFVDGEWVYNTVSGASQHAGAVWMQAQWHGDCNFGYHLIDGAIVEGDYVENSGHWNQYIWEYGDMTTMVPVGGGNNDTVPVAMHYPISGVAAAAGFVESEGDDPLEKLFEAGEALIDDRINIGMTDDAARSITESQVFDLRFHGLVACKGNVFGSEYFEATSTDLSVEIIFEAKDPEPGHGGDVGAGGGLIAETAITQAHLSVAPHPTNDCLVSASGTFVATQPTTIQYRLVNNFGQKSRLFSAEIDQTLVVHVSHEVEVAEAPAPADPGGTWAGEPVGGSIGGKVTEETDNVSDVLHFEVVTPHVTTSNHEGYSVAPCVPEPKTIFDPLSEKVPGRS